MNFKKLSLKGKLLILCFFLSAVATTIGGISYVNLKKVISDYDNVTTVNLPNIRLMGHLFASYRKVRIQLNTLGISGLTPAQAEKVLHELESAVAEYDAHDKTYQGIEFSEGEKELYDALSNSWSDFKNTEAQVVSLFKTGKSADYMKMIDILLVESVKKAHTYTEAFENLSAYHDQITKKWVSKADATANQAILLMFIIIFGGIGTGLTFGYLFANGVSKNINQVSQGLAASAEKVAQAASSIASASQQLSASATEQAAALQETTASVEETSSMISRNAENAKRSTEVSAQSQNAVNKGKQVVNEMIQSIEEISTSNTEIMARIEESNKEISDIVRLISDIGAKTKVINDIVFQTKLLSFNASVEAARAGESGKGFAVVAEEVGNLAQMSGNAAREISEMLEGSIAKVEGIVNNTRARVEKLILTGKEKVDVGTATAKRCVEVLDEIVRNVDEVSSLVTEISTASQEQAQGVQEINKAMTQLDQVAQQNNSASQQASVSAENLQALVTNLRGLVGTLNETVQGQEGSAKATRVSNTAWTKNPELRESAKPRTEITKRPSNVVELKEKKQSTPAVKVATAPVRTVPAVTKKAAGAEDFPSADDSRFEDV